MTSISSRSVFAALVCSAVLLLSACDSAEERAEGHYQNGIELLADGDVDRAIIEFRNTLELNGAHKQARLAFAGILFDQGRVRQAYRQYLAVAEQDPDDVEARKILSDLAVRLSSWDEAERHGRRLIELASDDPQARLMAGILAYRQAVTDEDASARRAAAADVAGVMADLDDLSLARQIIIDNLIRDNEFIAALPEIAAALEEDPDDANMRRQELALLNRLGRDAEFEERLVEAVERFPDDENFTQNLLRWYVSRGDNESAEAFLRERIALAAEGQPKNQARANLVVFLRQVQGDDAALAEVDRIVEETGGDVMFRSLRAGIRFDNGERDAAISELEDIVANEDSSDEIRDIKTALAQMQLVVGNSVAARQRVEEVLAEDSTHVDALKLRAGWLIDDDRADEAIVTLRTALDQAPQDHEIMTLIARAHLRNGSRGLAGEMLSLAAETSNNAPRESVAYARFLIAEENLSSAESVLVDSLRVTPNNQSVLTALGEVYVLMKDWPRLDQVEATLRRLDTPSAARTADGLRVARLRGERRGDEALEFLQSLVDREGTDSAAEVAVIRSHIADGNYAAAEAFIDGALDENPDRRLMRYLKAALYAATDRGEEARALYRELLDANAADEVTWRALYVSQLRDGLVDEARATLESALESVPQSPNLRWALAGELERDGDIDGAIDIYESLYESNPNATVVANNLASLIATYRDDPEQIERAYTIARRLRGIEVPQFQDTYGWLSYRRGDFAEALSHLEPAAAGLPGDPIVQFHLAMAYAATERWADAAEQFRRALDVAGPADSRPQFETARDELARIDAILAGAEPN